MKALEQLRPHEAAEYLGVKEGTLAVWRHYGRGPKYRKLGQHVYYPLADLNAWLEANTHQSTAEYPTRGDKAA